MGHWTLEYPLKVLIQRPNHHPDLGTERIAADPNARKESSETELAQTLASRTWVQAYAEHMTSIELGFDPEWVPEACTLPTIDQPLRLAEFDDLFTAVTAVDRVDATQATLTLTGAQGIAARARDLADRETACCSFFTFAITPAEATTATQEVIRMSISVPNAQAAVLATLVDRAGQQAGR